MKQIISKMKDIFKGIESHHSPTFMFIALCVLSHTLYSYSIEYECFGLPFSGDATW